MRFAEFVGFIVYRRYLCGLPCLLWKPFPTIVRLAGVEFCWNAFPFTVYHTSTFICDHKIGFLKFHKVSFVVLTVTFKCSLTSLIRPHGVVHEFSGGIVNIKQIFFPSFFYIF